MINNPYIQQCKKTIKNKLTPSIEMQGQSRALSKRISSMVQAGRRLNDDSQSSETTLTDAMRELVPYAEEMFEKIGAKIEHKATISLFECQKYFHEAGGPEPNINNKKVFMRPDGGILFATINNNTMPILIVEDKVQGTNDNLFEQDKKRQATGNAIERGAKNIRGAEMLFANMSIFPYVVFASGCDFHASETISKRIEMMNMGIPNHYIEISPNDTESVDSRIEDMLQGVTIRKVCGKGIASVFVKAHKWNEMKHGSSLWKKEEILKICKYIVDKIYDTLTATTPGT